jgi:transcription elongation factor Elf1
VKRKKTSRRAPLTFEQKDRYLQDLACPWCNCRDFPDGGTVTLDGGEAQALVSCPLCGATWREVYRLVRIEDVDTPGLKLVRAEEAE